MILYQLYCPKFFLFVCDTLCFINFNIYVTVLLLLPAMIERGLTLECQEVGLLFILPLLQIISGGTNDVEKEDCKSTTLASNVFANVQNLIFINSFEESRDTVSLIHTSFCKFDFKTFINVRFYCYYFKRLSLACLLESFIITFEICF